MKTNGHQVLHLSNLRLTAFLGILNHEKLAPQPIAIDASINLGVQPLLPLHDDIADVLDYRIVHDTILAVCTESHTMLLETLTGKVCHALMAITGILGVRIKITKLEIFDDCAVAIEQCAGHWD